MGRQSADSQRAGAQSRKERYKHYDEEYQFTFTEKAAYFLKLGIPIVGGLVVLVLVVVLLVNKFRAELRPDEAKEIEEIAAQQLLGDAARSYRGGDDILAGEKLRALVRQYPNSYARRTAEEALAKHAGGEPMFPKLPQSRDRAAGAAVSGEESVVKVPSEPPSSEPPSRPTPRVARIEPDEPETPDPGSDHERAVKEALARKPEIELGGSTIRRTLPEGFRPQIPAGVHASGWPAQIVCLRDLAEMVLVPGGTFVMGRDGGPGNEGPAHAVEISPFYIDRFEITREQYERFLAAHPQHPRPDAAAVKAMATPRHPAVGVRFGDVQAYLKWVGKVPPTEAQWELAARGTNSNRYPWGNDASLLPKGRKYRVIEPILQHLSDRSPFAVFDLSGNAAEWCRDWYLDDAYSETSRVDPVVFGDAPTFGKERVVRGGAPDWSVTWRGKLSETESAAWLGFRGVLEVPSDEAASPRGQQAPRSRRTASPSTPPRSADPVRSSSARAPKTPEKSKSTQDPIRDKPRSSSRKPDRR